MASATVTITQSGNRVTTKIKGEHGSSIKSETVDYFFVTEDDAMDAVEKAISATIRASRKDKS